jgi:prefoldin alpha subunit
MSEAPLNEEALTNIRTLQAEIEQIQASLNTLEQQLSLVNTAIGTLRDALSTQEELKLKKSGDEILIPFGGSNSVMCRIENPQEIFVSLGSGISLRTSLEDSQKRTQSQLENIQNSFKQLNNQYIQFSNLLSSKRENLVNLAQKYGVL